MLAIVRDMIKIYVIAQESAVILESVQLIADSGYDLDQFSPQRTSRPRPNELPAEKKPHNDLHDMGNTGFHCVARRSEQNPYRGRFRKRKIKHAKGRAS